ncbi:MAG: hypothetical protein AAGB34_05175 [Planctomycetota bacterium]
MSFSKQPNQDDQVNAYLDQEMSSQERLEFEEQLSADPRLRSNVDHLRDVEVRLTDMFGPSSVSAPPLPGRKANRFSIGKQSVLLAIAACLTIVVSVRLIQSNLAPEPIGFTVSELYARLSSPLEPQIVCDTPDKFLAYTREHLGASILANFDTDVTLVGWRSVPRRGYTDQPGRRVKVLLAETSDATPIVAVIYEPGAYEPNKRRSRDVRTFKGRVGNLHVLEITTLDEAKVVGLLYEEMP